MYSIYSRGGKIAPPDMVDAIPRRVVYSIRDKSFELLRRLKAGPARLDELYRLCRSRSEVVATFVSVLELCSVGSIEIGRCDDGYKLSFIGGDLEEIMEKIVE
jgi:segregation and condensation protein A